MADSARLVALLRGINVGRGNRVSNASLQGVVERLGYSDVSTYLQSGNIIFSSGSGAAAAASNVEQGLASELGLKVKVVVRSHAELVAAVAADPLREIATDHAKHLIGFLGGEPNPEGVRTLLALDAGPDQVHFHGRELYQWCPAGISASPFFKVAWERTLGTAVTMRNLNTVLKLIELSA